MFSDRNNVTTKNKLFPYFVTKDVVPHKTFADFSMNVYLNQKDQKIDTLVY